MIRSLAGRGVRLSKHLRNNRLYGRKFLAGSSCNISSASLLLANTKSIGNDVKRGSSCNYMCINKRVASNLTESHAELHLPDSDLLRRRLISWMDIREDSGVHIHTNFTHQKKINDLDALVNNFTAPALARALRDREQTLAALARLVSLQKYDEMKNILTPFGEDEYNLPDSNYVNARGEKIKREISRGFSGDHESLTLPNLSNEGGLFQYEVLERMKHRLNRIPREIATRSSRRACVILPLCLDQNKEASVLFTLRSNSLRRHKGEVCFPGGMVDKMTGENVVKAGLREMEEEIGVTKEETQVMGILRCDWTEVQAITGISVTPVIGYLGALSKLHMKLNPGEVSRSFTVPVMELLDKRNWNLEDPSAPVFRYKFSDDEKNYVASTAEPHEKVHEHVIWGLTGYLLYRFVKLLPSVVFENYRSAASTGQ